MICVLSAVIWIWRQRRPGVFSKPNLEFILGGGFLSQYFTFKRVGLVLQQIFQFGNYIFRLGNTTLEGEGGLLWAFLMLIIFFSLVVQFSQVR